MIKSPIQKVTDKFQYRAIGIIYGSYNPLNNQTLNKGKIKDLNGMKLDAVVLGKALPLIKKHIDFKKKYYWIVYPRNKNVENLHVQIAGIWDPYNLNDSIDKNDVIFDIKNIEDDWNKFLERVNIKKPSIASILEGSKPLKINNFIIEIKIISNHDFHLDMLDNNADSIRSILKDVFESKLDFVIIKGDENAQEKEQINEDVNGSQNDNNKDIQDKIVNLFDGEIIN